MAEERTLKKKERKIEKRSILDQQATCANLTKERMETRPLRFLNKV